MDESEEDTPLKANWSWGFCYCGAFSGIRWVDADNQRDRSLHRWLPAKLA